MDTSSSPQIHSSLQGSLWMLYILRVWTNISWHIPTIIPKRYCDINPSLYNTLVTQNIFPALNIPWALPWCGARDLAFPISPQFMLLLWILGSHLDQKDQAPSVTAGGPSLAFSSRALSRCPLSSWSWIQTNSWQWSWIFGNGREAESAHVCLLISPSFHLLAKRGASPAPLQETSERWRWGHRAQRRSRPSLPRKTGFLIYLETVQG